MFHLSAVGHLHIHFRFAVEPGNWRRFFHRANSSYFFQVSQIQDSDPKKNIQLPSGLLVDMDQQRMNIGDVAALTVVDACAQAGQLLVGQQVMKTLLKDVPPVVPG